MKKKLNVFSIILSLQILLSTGNHSSYSTYCLFILPYTHSYCSYLHYKFKVESFNVKYICSEAQKFKQHPSFFLERCNLNYRRQLNCLLPTSKSLIPPKEQLRNRTCISYSLKFENNQQYSLIRSLNIVLCAYSTLQSFKQNR